MTSAKGVGGLYNCREAILTTTKRIVRLAEVRRVHFDYRKSRRKLVCLWRVRFHYYKACRNLVSLQSLEIPYDSHKACRKRLVEVLRVRVDFYIVGCLYHFG